MSQTKNEAGKLARDPIRININIKRMWLVAAFAIATISLIVNHH